MNRPSIAPGLVAEALGRLPSRLQKRLDGDRTLAEGWRWEVVGDGLRVVAEAETVSLPATAVASLDELRCTCLMAPRCVHVGAVVLRLPLAEASVVEVASSEALAEEAEPAPDGPLRAAGGAALEALAEALARGFSRFGPVVEAPILRSLHDARALGLHRLARALLRVLELGRDLREGNPEFRLGELREALAEGLVTAAGLSEGSVGWIGRGRRDYDELTGRRLWGLYAEPIVTATGFVGVVSGYVDLQGPKLYEIGQVRPGAPSLAKGAHQGALGFGGIHESVAEVSRRGLFIASARASSDGRLGGGAGVQAAAAVEVGRFDEAPLAALWERPIVDQLDQGLLFLDVQLGDADGLGLGALARLPGGGGVAVTLVAGSDHPDLPWVERLHDLSLARGAVVRIIARPHPGRDGAVVPLAIGAVPGFPLHLPEVHRGRLDVGFDRLSPGFFPEVAPGALVVGEVAPRRAPLPLTALSRRLDRLTLGGRGTLPEGLAGDLRREAQVYEDQFLPTAARLLRELYRAARSAERGLSGEARVREARALALAWLRAEVWRAAVERGARREVWGAASR